jgi:PAS domain S-box-containing protein
MPSVLAQANDSAASDDAAMRQLLQAVEALVITLSPKGEIVDCNGTCEEVGGFSAAELVGRNVANAFAVQEESDLFQRRLSDLAAGDPSSKFETFLFTKRGDRKRIRWSGVQLEVADRPYRMLLLTGIDITREYEANERLARSEENAARLQEKLIRISSKYNLSDETGVERRSERRLNFPRQQRIAPMENNRLPAADKFFMVEFRNVGAQGCAFFLEAPPTTREYVVELGNGANAIHLTAEVRHATLARTADTQRYLVGCKFTGRVNG